jgi:predicted DNA-binding protein (MmcQ/YjbR family)
MTTHDTILSNVREICLTLPDTKETPTWGTPHFRVGEKIFAGYGVESGRAGIGFKLSMERQAQMLRDKRFTKAPYVGHKGWVSMDVTDQRDWEEVRSLVLESYRAIASKKSLAKLSPAMARPAPAAAKPAKAAEPKKLVAAPAAKASRAKPSRPRRS